MKTIKTKKTYEKPSMKEHELRHHTSLLAGSPDQFGMNSKLIVPEPEDGDENENGSFVPTEAW